jgi:glutamate-ammonia-ligase adenylyltransferase
VKARLWSKVARASADPERARHFFESLSVTAAAPTIARAPESDLKLWAQLFAGSPALGNVLVANPTWLAELTAHPLREPRRKSGLQADWRERARSFRDARDAGDVLAAVRQFKQREALRIAARDLNRLSDVAEITRELSDLGDVCLQVVWEHCVRQHTERFGAPFHQDSQARWQPTEAGVLGLGKLGGQELNYSSDVDVLFVYDDEGSVFKDPPGRGKGPRAVMPNHQFFNRVAEAFIAEIARPTREGTLYRIDLRLRPEGDAGPLTRSLASYENYYSQWGQTWERMMLIKARGVAGSASLAHEFLEMVQPFRHPRLVNERVLRDVAAIKARIENEVVRAGELDRNVKLGRGGIREIEFVVQSLQLLHAGRQPFLQGAQTLPTLAKLAQYRLIEPAEAEALRAAYCFLRDVEHRLQMEENAQTHTIPAEPEGRERLARLMGYENHPAFEVARAAHTHSVRRTYDRVLRADVPAQPTDLPERFDGCEAEWQAILERHWFRDPEAALRRLREFVEGPGFVHVSQRTSELARELLPKLLALCRTDERESPAAQLPEEVLSDPDRVLTRLDSFISAYGTRAALFELWSSNPALLELLILLFDRSEFLAERAIRVPDLVDELVLAGRLRQRKAGAEILADLRHGREDEDQFAWLRRYHEAEFMRIGLRDILGLADMEQNFGELSALADACLQYGLEVIMRRHHLRTPPFVVIGLGKLGGSEINYGSDLDVIFVAETRSAGLTRAQKLAAELMDLISRRTEHGQLFALDARLRPDGEKGLLVNTLAAYEDYYRQRAQLWEIQALTRTRPVAGEMEVGNEFQKIAMQLTDFSRLKNEPPHVGCYGRDWKQRINDMRRRIEKERTPAGKDELAIKSGRGGLVDAEFIAQALCLENGWHEPHTLRALERGRATGSLPDAGKLIENYQALRRVEGILRRWSYEGETVLPVEPEPFYRVAVRCGFSTPEAFRRALAGWRQSVREVYARYFTVG